MNSTRRFVVRTGSAVALLVLLVTGFARAESANYVFQNQTLSFTHLIPTAGGTAVGVNDPGFQALLKSIGATLTWRPGERYVLLATPQPLVVNFSIGQKRYDNGLLTSIAAFAPFVKENEAYLPFGDVMRALSLAIKNDGSAKVLEPQLTSFDVQGSGSQAIIVAHAAVPLHARVVSEAPDRIVYAFEGVTSSIDGTRTVDAGGIRSLQIVSSGSVRAPRTTVTLSLAQNTRHDSPHSNNGDFEVAFGANGGAPPLVAAAAAPAPEAVPLQQQQQPVAAPQPSATAAPADGANGAATVSGVTVQNTGNGATVTIAVTGNATYEWHRLRDPDNRFWIDIKNAQLPGGPRDETEGDPLISMRTRQLDPQTVRVAISLNGAKQLQVLPAATGVVVSVGRDVALDDARTGSGTIGAVVSANEPQTLVTPVPADMYGVNPSGNTDDGTWKFGGRSTYVPTNPRLIIIDPGHGGSDPGAQRNGVSEKSLSLDMAKRLRDVLIARGWQVQMTRDTDIDVYQANDSARDELQSRIDIATRAGARMLVSIHVNSFVNSGPSGTTTYYSKPVDVPLALSVEHAMDPLLGTKDDGIVKSRLYMTLHSPMPAVLVETAFLSNPDDFSKLISPDWREKVAEGIASGIDRYAAQNPVSGSAQ